MWKKIKCSYCDLSMNEIKWFDVLYMNVVFPRMLNDFDFWYEQKCIKKITRRGFSQIFPGGMIYIDATDRLDYWPTTIEFQMVFVILKLPTLDFLIGRIILKRWVGKLKKIITIFCHSIIYSPILITTKPGMTRVQFFCAKFSDAQTALILDTSTHVVVNLYVEKLGRVRMRAKWGSRGSEVRQIK